MVFGGPRVLKRIVTIIATIAAVTHGVESGAADADVLTIAAPTIPETRGNPYSNLGLPFGLTNQMMFDPLVVIGDDGQLQPWLAASWRQTADNTWIVVLKDGIKFSNGEPLEAAAVVAAIEYVAKPTAPSDAIGWNAFREALLVAVPTDRLTVEITTRHPVPILMYQLMRLLVPAPGAWRALGREGFANAPVGTGPYRMTRWRAGNVSYRANTSSWRPARIGRAEIIQVIDQAARLQAVLSGAADVAIQLPPDVAADALADFGGSLYPRLVPNISQIQFVTKSDGPLRDVRVRRALNFAVNREALTATFFHGAVAPASQFAHEQSIGYDASLAPLPFDPERARRLLAEAGYPSGFSFTMSFVTDGGGPPDVYQQIAADLKRVGVTMVIRPFTVSTLMQRLGSGEWQEDAFATAQSGYDPVVGAMVRSCLWPQPHHCDPNAVPLIEATRAASSLAAYRDSVRTLMHYEHDNPPALMLWRAVAFDGLSPRVSGYEVRNDMLLIERTGLRRSP